MEKNLLPIPDDPKLVMLDVAKAVNRAKRKHPDFVYRLFDDLDVSQRKVVEASMKARNAHSPETGESALFEEIAEAATKYAELQYMRTFYVPAGVKNERGRKELYNEILDIAAVAVRMAEAVAKGGANE